MPTEQASDLKIGLTTYFLEIYTNFVYFKCTFVYIYKLGGIMKKTIYLVLLISTITFGVVGSSQAITEGPFTQTVSCDATITNSLKTFFQASTGGLSFIKVGDTSDITQAVNAFSSSGNGIGWKTVGPSGTLNWTNVLSSDYTFKIKPSTSFDCNGWLIGDGNTDLTYKVTHK